MGVLETYSLYSLIYLIPAYLIYLIFAICIFTKKSTELKSPFFNIIKVLAVVDLSVVVLYSIGYRMGYLLSLCPLFGPPGKANGFMTFVVYSASVLGHTQMYLHVCLAFNRLSAIILPNYYNTLWSGNRFTAIISSLFIFPAIYLSWICYFGGSILYKPIYQTFIVDNISTGSPLVSNTSVVGVVSTGKRNLLSVARAMWCHLL